MAALSGVDRNDKAALVVGGATPGGIGSAVAEPKAAVIHPLHAMARELGKHDSNE
jgi:hypothetical protein